MIGTLPSSWAIDVDHVTHCSLVGSSLGLGGLINPPWEAASPLSIVPPPADALSVEELPGPAAELAERCISEGILVGVIERPLPGAPPLVSRTLPLHQLQPLLPATLARAHARASAAAQPAAAAGRQQRQQHLASRSSQEISAVFATDGAISGFSAKEAKSACKALSAKGERCMVMSASS